MLKCKITKGKSVQVQIKGTGEDITTETLTLIKQVYHGIKKASEPAADIYRRAVIGSLIDPNSPVWKGEQG